MYKNIENRILSLCKYVKEILVVQYNNEPFAFIYPDFEELKKAKIINIENEIRWYGIELYNMEVDDSKRLNKYKFFSYSLPKTSLGKFDKELLIQLIDADEYKDIDAIFEPSDELYKKLKSILCGLTTKEVTPSSHVELDLGLDSLDYVELFILIEQSFGVKIDEAIFSKMMVVETLYEYIKEHQRHTKESKMKWDEILNEPIKKKLIYSPIIMSMYKIVLLPFFKLYFRLEVINAKNTPLTSCVIAPSHQSMLDGFLVLATLPFSVLVKSFFIAYKQVFGTGILKPMAIHGQNILIDADKHLKETLQYSALPLKEEKNLVIFPEGARSRDRKLLEFRPFFAILSKTFNVPVVPVVVDGGFEALRSGKSVPRPKKIRVTYLEPIYPKGLSYSEITTLTRDAIDEEMKKNPLQ